MILMLASLWLAAAADVSAAPPVRCEASPSVQSVAPGVPFDVICTIHVPPGWHVYWEDPGASGEPTLVEVESDAAMCVAGTRYPRPTRLHAPEGIVNALSGLVVLAVPVTLSPDLQPGAPIDLRVRVDWFLCKDRCFIGGAEMTLRIALTETPGPPTEAAASVRALPKPISARRGTTLQLHAGVLEVSGPIDAAGPPAFLPVRSPGIVWGDPQTTRDEKAFHMRVPVGYDQRDHRGSGIRGLLMFGTNPTGPAWMIDTPLEAVERDPGKTQEK
jgi:DsbC/DsbD-like thiol-disulfide interchange protein